MELWDRQPDENDKAWRAFVAYRDAGLHRRYQDSQLPFADTAKLAAAHGWAERVRAFDTWAEKIRQDERERTIRAVEAKITQEATETACMAIQVAANSLRAALLRQAESPTAEVIDPKLAIKLLSDGVKTLNLVQGKPTDNLQISLADLTPEEIALLRKR